MSYVTNFILVKIKIDVTFQNILTQYFQILIELNVWPKINYLNLKKEHEKLLTLAEKKLVKF